MGSLSRLWALLTQRPRVIVVTPTPAIIQPPKPPTMSKKITEQDFRELAAAHGIPYASLRAVAEVEAAGSGYGPDGKILIQFEPLWFKRLFAGWRQYVAGQKWATNTVGTQSVEWPAFNSAFSVNPDAAMESTSIGMMQVMGFHWKDLGFKSVGAMWDYAKESERNQLDLGIRFIRKKAGLLKALLERDWRTFAYGYNGQQYEKFDYHNRLAKAYKKYI